MSAPASIPIALCEAAEAGLLRKGQRVVLAAVGGGLSWAAMVLEWSATTQTMAHNLSALT